MSGYFSELANELSLTPVDPQVYFEGTTFYSFGRSFSFGYRLDVVNKVPLAVELVLAGSLSPALAQIARFSSGRVKTNGSVMARVTEEYKGVHGIEREVEDSEVPPWWTVIVDQAGIVFHDSQFVPKDVALHPAYFKVFERNGLKFDYGGIVAYFTLLGAVRRQLSGEGSLEGSVATSDFSRFVTWVEWSAGRVLDELELDNLATVFRTPPAPVNPDSRNFYRLMVIRGESLMKVVLAYVLRYESPERYNTVLTAECSMASVEDYMCRDLTAMSVLPVLSGKYKSARAFYATVGTLAVDKGCRLVTKVVHALVGQGVYGSDEINSRGSVSPVKIGSGIGHLCTECTFATELGENLIQHYRVNHDLVVGVCSSVMCEKYGRLFLNYESYKNHLNRYSGAHDDGFEVVV